MNNRELGLFFDRKYIIDPITMVEKVNNKIPLLGEVTILPIDEKQNNPVIIYDKSDDIKLYFSFTNILIHVSEKKYDHLSEYIKTILNILKSFNIKVTRVGFINTKILGIKERDLFANNAFDAKEIIDANEFQLSYYQTINYDEIKLNCWKRYLTSHENFMVVFDINTIQSDNHNVNYSFIIEFVLFAINYMNENSIVKLY